MSFAQEDERNAIIEKRIEFIGEDLEDSDIDFTTYLEELYFFYDNPINLNQTNFDELSRLNLMTDVQIISILDYQILSVLALLDHSQQHTITHNHTITITQYNHYIN